MCKNVKKLDKRNLHAHDRKIYEKSNNQVIKLKPKWTYVIFPKILINCLDDQGLTSIRP